MKKFLILFAFLIGFGLLGIFIYKMDKNYGFFSRESVNYYEANPQKSGNYYKANYYKTVPNYYKANSENADNYVNPDKNPPENYYKAPSAKKPTTREGKKNRGNTVRF